MGFCFSVFFSSVRKSFLAKLPVAETKKSHAVELMEGQDAAIARFLYGISPPAVLCVLIRTHTRSQLTAQCSRLMKNPGRSKRGRKEYVGLLAAFSRVSKNSAHEKKELPNRVNEMNGRICEYRISACALRALCSAANPKSGVRKHQNTLLRSQSRTHKHALLELAGGYRQRAHSFLFISLSSPRHHHDRMKAQIVEANAINLQRKRHERIAHSTFRTGTMAREHERVLHEYTGHRLC